MAEPITVLIADDHTLVREGVRLLLNAQPDFRVVAEAADGVRAVQMARECRPDLILLDLRMPEMNGLQALEEILCEQPGARVVILSMYDSGPEFFHALGMGAAGYILKGAASAEMIDALRVIAAGENYLSPRLTTLLVKEFQQIWQPAPYEGPNPGQILSSREMEVLMGLAEGKTNAEIARELFISASTVQTHRTRILEKLSLRTRSDLVKYALKHHLIRLE